MAGTVLVKDIRPGTIHSSLGFLTDVNGTLFFSANDGTSGLELWKSDGTEAGTVLVKDILPGSGGSRPFLLMDVNGTLFFRANDGASGEELWKSDGTAAGTVRVKDISPGSSGSRPDNLTDVNGTLYFSANDGASGFELWKSDGTVAGTVLVKDIRPGSGGSSPSRPFDLNGTLYFSARDGTSGSELWKSDGTQAGTVLVHDISPGPDHSFPSRLTDVNGTLFFAAITVAHGQELWVVHTDVNEAPSITSAATVDAAENQTAAIDVQSSDPDGETEAGGGLSYSKTGGADQALFSIDTNTGVLAFNAAPDFENPGDAGANNVYDVQVTVTDAGGLTDVQEIAVTVTNVNEAPKVILSGLISANEGDTKSYSFTATDPEGDTFSLVSQSCGTNGTLSNDSFNTTTGAGSFDCTFPDGPNSSDARVQVKDSDQAASNTDTITVSIANVAPRVNVSPETAANFSGETHDISATFSDPGVNDALWNWTIDWGDTSSDSGSTTDQSAAIVGSHQYFEPRDYTITITVTDKDGDTGSDAQIKTVVRLPVTIDIKPGSDPNSLNLNGNGVVPVAIFSRADFDATAIVPNTVQFGLNGDDAAPVHGGHIRDVNGDGFDDLVLHFREGELGIPIDPEGNGVTLTITGVTTANVWFEGQDEVRITPNNANSRGKGGKGPKLS